MIDTLDRRQFWNDLGSLVCDPNPLWNTRFRAFCKTISKKLVYNCSKYVPVQTRGRRAYTVGKLFLAKQDIREYIPANDVEAKLLDFMADTIQAHINFLQSAESILMSIDWSNNAANEEE